MMDNKAINKKAEIAEIIKKFKQNLELKSGEINERRLKMLKGCIERNEKVVNDKDETDTEYINDELNNIKCVFNGFCSMYNIDYVPTTINNSTFIIASEWLRLKRSVLNPNNNDNKCFQYSVIYFLYIMNRLEKIL